MVITAIFMEVIYYITITCNWKMDTLHPITLKKCNDYNALPLHITPGLLIIFFVEVIMRFWADFPIFHLYLYLPCRLLSFSDMQVYFELWIFLPFIFVHSQISFEVARVLLFLLFLLLSIIYTDLVDHSVIFYPFVFL